MTSVRSNRELAFNLFKYAVYFLLTYNIWLFFQEESLATSVNYADGIPFGEIISAFASTIDTLAWVILLWVFELETAIIPDDKLKGKIKWLLLVVRAFCYTFIFYAVYGYLMEYLRLANFTVTDFKDACQLVGDHFGIILSADNIIPLTVENCKTLQGQEIYQIANTKTIGGFEQLQGSATVALIDVINSHTWVLILVILELDVYLQLKGVTHSNVIKASNAIKSLFYITLFGCAVWWWFDGDFLDFWDAFLWLVAFIFIEMNIFNWREDTEREQQVC
jgi:hypothetical protein